MCCPFCGWGMGLGGTDDPCDIVVAFEDHLADHVEDMLLDARNPSLGS